MNNNIEDGSIVYRVRSIHGNILRAKYLYCGLEITQTADVEFGNDSHRCVMKTCIERRKSTNAKVITTATAVRLVINSFALQKGDADCHHLKNNRLISPETNMGS